LGLSLVLIAISCNNSSENTSKKESSQSEDVNELKKEVMDVHDRTMAQMNTMAKLRNQLKDKWQSEEVTDTAVYYRAYASLQKAHDKMMSWMQDFSQNYDESMDADAKKAYLNKEKEKINILAKFTDQSIDEAEDLLK